MKGILAVAMAALAALLAGGGAWADDIVAAGKDLCHQRCTACHSVEPGGRHGVGPNLFAVVGAKAGTKEGYRYSPAHAAASAVIWDEATLDRYLEDVQAMVPGTKKVFQGMTDPLQRKALIAYLKTLK